MEYRRQTWDKLAGPWKLKNLESTVTEIGLDGLEDQISAMLKGQTRGRILVKVGG